MILEQIIIIFGYAETQRKEHKIIKRKSFLIRLLSAFCNIFVAWDSVRIFKNVNTFLSSDHLYSNILSLFDSYSLVYRFRRRNSQIRNQNNK